jgi:hypothetical protein
MPMTCPYCLRDNPDAALVCSVCSRDIAIPAAVAAERLELIQKRDLISAELKRVEHDIAELRDRRPGRGR